VLPATSYYVAGIDIAGPAEDPQDADHLLRATKPRKDSTVVLIAEVTPTAGGPNAGHPITRIVEAYWWTGRPLYEQCDRLIGLLKETWSCAKVVVDASGLGLDLATRLQRAMGAAVVEPFPFSVSSKSDLAYALLAHASSGRLQMWNEEPSPSGRGQGEGAPRLRTKPSVKAANLAPSSQGYAALSPEANEFWREVDRARPIHRSTGSGAFGANKLSFYVPEHYGHDDFLVALALVSRAACSQPAVSEYIPPLSFVLPPPPSESDLEERALHFDSLQTQAQQSFLTAYRRTLPSQ